MIHLFSGFDRREEVGHHVFCSSVIHNATAPVSFTPLHSGVHLGYDGQRDGSNAFTYSRFLIPFLMGYQGWAIFMDGADMVVRGDVAELWSLRDDSFAVQVVKHSYKTKHPRKYIGTDMESHNRDYFGKNWSSVMLINCAHPEWRQITPRSIEGMSGEQLHRFSFMESSEVGELPVEWNWLVDEFGENENAEVLHWTAGIPAFPNYKNAPMAEEWFKAEAKMKYATP